MIEIIENINGVDSIKQIWQDLEKGKRYRIFQSYLWCCVAWKIFFENNKDNKLWIIHWYNANDHIILPTYIDSSGNLRFIYDTDNDVCDGLYKEGLNHNIAYNEIVKKIKANLIIKKVCFQKLHGNSEVLNYFSVMLKGSIVAKDNAYSWIKIDTTVDFISSQYHMKSKDRADLKCMYRQVSKYSLYIVSKKDGILFPEKELLELRSYMQTTKKRDNNFLTKESIDFIKMIYENNGCDIAILKEAEDLQAANILLKKDENILSWVFLYKDPHASTALYLKYFCEYHYYKPFIFDFGVGVYNYKIGTFRPYLEKTLALRWSKSLLGYFYILIKTNVRFLKDYLKAKIN